MSVIISGKYRWFKPFRTVSRNPVSSISLTAISVDYENLYAVEELGASWKVILDASRKDHEEPGYHRDIAKNDYLQSFLKN